jgi:hypothetical protein
VLDLLLGVLGWPWFSERHGYDFNGTLVPARGGEPGHPDRAALGLAS